MVAIPQTGENWTDRLPVLVSLTLAALALFEAGRLLPLFHAAPPPVPAGPVAPVSSGTYATDLGVIVKAHLFGTAVDTVAARESLGDWELSGVIATLDPGDGYAIIGRKSQPVRVWHTGATLPGGASLYQVLHDRVVINDDGQLLIVRLPKQRSALLQLAAAEVPVEQAPMAVAKASLEQSAIEASASERMFSGLLAEPAGSRPGLILHPQGGLRRHFDLKDGDVLTAINGVPVTSSDSAATVLQQSSGESLNLSIVRDGMSMVASLPIGRR